MKCVDCEKHSYIVGRWCDATKKPKRISEKDAHKDAPCKYVKESER